jgi:hypothetical protein
VSVRIFINYRREDTAGYAGRLYDALATRFGDSNVFMDIDKIEPGLDFTEVIDHAVGSSDVVIALIGRRWLDAADAAGRRRLDNPLDFVRAELSAALAQDRRVIPVLVQGAEMPPPDELPESLQRLAFRHALELTDVRWRYDVERLIGSLERMQGDTETVPGERPRRARVAEEVAPQRRGGARRRLPIVAALAALLVAGGAVAAWIALGSGSSGSSNAAKSTSTKTGGAPTTTARPSVPTTTAVLTLTRTVGGTVEQPSVRTFAGRYFTVDRPADWRVESAERSNGTIVDTTIVDPTSSATYLRIDVNPNTSGSPRQQAAPVLRALRAQSGYRELDLSDDRLDGFPALHWEFLVSERGVLLHKEDEFFSDSAGNGIAILTQAPASDYARLRPLFDAVRASFSAASGGG